MPTPSRILFLLSGLPATLILGSVLLWPLQSGGGELESTSAAAELEGATEVEEAANGATSTIRQMLQTEVIGPMDSSRDYLAGQFVGFAGYIDRFFGGDRNYQESNQSVLQLDLTRAIRRGTSSGFILSGRTKMHLPNIEKRLHLVLETNPEENVGGEQARTAAPTEQGATQDSLAAAARIENDEERFWHLSADAGIQLQGADTSPFTRLRGRIEVPLDKWSLKATETFFWFRTTGTGATTQFDFERHINEPELFRASTNATWLMKTGNFDLRQDFSLYHAFDERTALLYQASVIGVSKPELQASEYILLFLYRYRLHQQWMYAELSPQLHYPQADNYRVLPMLVLRLEVLFDDPN